MASLGRATGVVAVIVLFMGLSAAQAIGLGRYTVNEFIQHTQFIDKCASSINCVNECASALTSKCSAFAPTFCYPDTAVSSSFGGVVSANCSDVEALSSVLCPFSSRMLGNAICSGWCNVECFGCECNNDADCTALLGTPEWGTWDCRSCYCMLLNSPLVLNLQDYFPNGDKNQNWWKRGFCGSEAPTVCLDWRGDGDVTCTAWTEPGSAIAFVVTLSGADALDLIGGLPIRAEPWRHLFGNVTMGPGGDFPFEHGFAALAAHCGQATAAESALDLTECGSSLYAWNDRNVDGYIELGELLQFESLGIESLGDVRKTGKKDKCGNTFQAESDATCADGKCGTWLDVFFEAR